MNYQTIIERLKALSSEKYKANVIKMGIPENDSLGVSTSDIRKLAKSIPNSNQTAYQLWNSNYHEAKLLAVLIFEKKKITLSEIKILINDVNSWDLCDHFCKNLIIKVPDYENLIYEWIVSNQTYIKRAAFTLIASDVIHNKKISDKTINNYLILIKNHSHDDQIHIKKAVTWALKEIGKKNFNYHEKALILAYELSENGDKTQQWIAKNALKELENLVKVEGRTRLISRNSKMSKENL